jgi:hypothetical protein
MANLQNVFRFVGNKEKVYEIDTRIGDKYQY